MGGVVRVGAGTPAWGHNTTGTAASLSGLDWYHRTAYPGSHTQEGVSSSSGRGSCSSTPSRPCPARLQSHRVYAILPSASRAAPLLF